MSKPHKTRTVTIDVDDAELVGSPLTYSEWYLKLQEYKEAEVKTRVRIQLTAGTICYLLARFHEARKRVKDQLDGIDRSLKGEL